MSRKITRTYFSKKKNTYVTKTYEYKTVSKGGTAVYKSGKVNIEKLKQVFTNPKEYERALDVIDIYKSQYNYKKFRLSIKSLKTKMLTSNIEKYLTNFGMDADEFAAQMSVENDEVVDSDWVLNESNWDGSTFILPSGKKVELSWDYKGGMLI